MPKSSEILGRERKSPRISENFGNASNPFLRSLNDLWNFWKTWETVQKCFPDVFMFFLNFRKIFGNLRNCSEIFGKFRERFKSNFQIFLWFFKIVGKSLEIFGSVRKPSEIFEKLRKRFKSNFLMFLIFLKIFGKIFGNLRKCSKIIGKFPDVIGNVRNGSQELKSFGAGFLEVLKRTPVNC